MKRVLVARPDESHRRGFTLIELLVVIAIIAILAAILFPVFAKARENARKSTCQSHLKQLGLGMMQYVQDYDETFPPLYYDINGTGPRVWWSTVMQPYLKNWQIATCPSMAILSNTWKDAQGHYYGYAAPGAHTFTTTPLPLAKLTKPAEIMMLVEGEYSWTHFCPTCRAGGDTCCGGNTNNNGCKPPYSPSTGRHMDGSNVAYFDGHVKWQRNSTLQSDANLWGHNGF